MTDQLTPDQRSRLMARVVGKDTKPEWILRSALHRLGFRYRLGGGGLPGRPDLILPKYRAVVFVHGCFWHHHADCKRATLPRTNAAFWKEKLERNVARDAEAVAVLEASGWKVIVVWECELYRDPVAVAFRVVSALTDGAAVPEDGGCDIGTLDPRRLLQVAEEKRRYRIGPKTLKGDVDQDG
ncbi:very short patch repair endonuclease [Thiocapsa bogorovii]|uniref:very short patch repair endonuclease n=1 Tax=Thiocapsa bogorovii TaxID=521689 RepID=UPI001E5A0A79|nr:very short patch repair endonuclease [Thiocapsa bogorovii]UHD17664.1 very short patch repair endonuclease [Thiocapsa bogorovii]